MPLIDADKALRFAEGWVSAWNRHDLDGILSHYADDFEFFSPMIVDIMGEPSGRLKGKTAVSRYWALGLERLPNLHFRLLDVLAGVDRIVLCYEGHSGRVAECFEFDEKGRVVRAAACYGP